MAGVAQAIRVGAIHRQPLRLAVGSELATAVGAFVPVDAEPAQVLENALGRGDGGARLVGVLEPKHERPALAAREEPVEQRGPGVTDVKVPRRTRGETNAHQGIIADRG